MRDKPLCIGYLVLCHLHVEDDVVNDLVDGAFDGSSESRDVNQGMHKLKDTVDKVLKAQYLPCQSTENTTH